MKKILNLLVIFFAIIGVISCSSSLVNFVQDKHFFDDSIIDEESSLIVDEVDFSTLNIAFLGDSITNGCNGENPSTTLENPYCKLVGETLGFNKVYNYGIGSSSLSKVFNSSGEVIKSNPMCERANNLADDIDIVGLLGGINDYFYSAPLGDISSKDETTIYGALNIIAETLKSKYDFVFFMTPYKRINWTSNNSQGYDVSAVAYAVKSVAKKHVIPCLDLFNDGNAEIDFSKTDGTHFSQDFVTNYTAPQIVQFIKDNYK